MVVNLKFSKFDDTPWGFRLIGGTDFDIPLTVVKVNEQSLSEAAGLLAGDIIVRINDTPTSNLTHVEAHDLLIKSGNNFVFGVLRGEEAGAVQHVNLATLQYENMHKNSAVSSENISIRSSAHSECEVSVESHTTQSQSMQSHIESQRIIEGGVKDDVIAELISGEAELLKDHNVIGVNFKKIMPATEHIKNSEVLSQLNREVLQTKAEMDKEEQLEQEHQQRLIRERTPKAPAHHAFGPLTPQERPIHLPGGRKWRNSKDAFNEEFIAEVLSSQAELIKGTTLGVNFLKYQKPEKKVNLENSEVYRLIHHLDSEPKRGVEARPEKVPAIQDIQVS